MSNINHEETNHSLTTLFRNVLFRWSKSALHTCRPGIIESYDPETKRARVRAGLRMVLTGAEPGEDGEAMEPAVSINVPVLFPFGGGHTMTFPLAQGDPVMLFFSERGLTEFKTTYALATPDKTHFFSEADAVAFAGFGALQITPASSVGATLQTEDGTTFVEIAPEVARIRHQNTEVVVEDDHVTVNAGRVDIAGTGGKRLMIEDFIQLFNSHTHPTAAVGSPSPPTQRASVASHATGKTWAE